MSDYFFMKQFNASHVFDCRRRPTLPGKGDSLFVTDFALPYKSKNIQFTKDEIKNCHFKIRRPVSGSKTSLYLFDAKGNPVTGDGKIFDGKIYAFSKDLFLFISDSHPQIFNCYCYLFDVYSRFTYGNYATYTACTGEASADDMVKYLDTTGNADVNLYFPKKFPASNVFDCQRTPFYPVKGVNFRAYSFGLPYKAANSQFSQSELNGRHFKFSYQYDKNLFALHLFNADGTPAFGADGKIFCGKIYGFSENGFLFVGDTSAKPDGYGFFFDTKAKYSMRGEITYKPDTGAALLADTRKYLYDLVALPFPERPERSGTGRIPSNAVNSINKRFEDTEKMARDIEDAGGGADASEAYDLLKEFYSLTVELLDSGNAEKNDAEKEIYDFCKAEIAKKQKPNGWLAVAFFAAAKVRDSIGYVKKWFHLDSDKDKANMKIKEAGNDLLPVYMSILYNGFLQIVDIIGLWFVYGTDFEKILIAQGIYANYQENRPVGTREKKQRAYDMCMMADFALKGHTNGVKDVKDYKNLTKGNLPVDLHPLYDEANGILEGERGLRAWLGQNNSEIVISFAGTNDFHTVYADAEQLFAPSGLYLNAAGLVSMIYKTHPSKKIFVTGHSLGGGLTEFAVIANTKNMKDGDANLYGYGFNPAGLSFDSILHLTLIRLAKAKSIIEIYLTSGDWVSLLGGKIGCLVTLPTVSGKSGHLMDDVIECMKEYNK